MKYFGWIFLFFVLVYIMPLASRPLASSDEFRYAEIPREMIASGDYVTPRLIGMRYFEKTPMCYWLVAGSMKIFGENNFAVRFPMAVAAGITALFIWIMVQQMTRDEKLAALSSIIFLSFLMVYILGTTAVTDMIFSMFVIGSGGCIFLAVQEKRFNRRKLLLTLLTGIFVGLGFLTKGFLAFAIPAVTVAVYLCWERRWKEFLILPVPVLLTAVAVIVPWGIAIHRAQPDFWHYFVFVEHLNRFFGGVEAQHPEPWYYFIPVLLVGMMPAGLLIPAAGFVGKDVWKGLIKLPMYRYSLCFLIMPLLLFSCSSGKLPTYILCCFAPAAILIAAGVRAYFNSGGHHRSYNWTMSAWGSGLIVAGACLIAVRVFPGLVAPGVLAKLPVSNLFYPVMGCVAVFAGGLMLYSTMGNWRGRLYLFFFGVGLLMFSFNWFFVGSKKFPEVMFREVVKQFNINSERTLIYTTGRHMHTIAWICKRTDFKVIEPGENRYGCEAAEKNGEESILVPLADLNKSLKDPARARDIVVIMHEKHGKWKNLPASNQQLTMYQTTAKFYPAPLNTRKEW